MKLPDQSWSRLAGPATVLAALDAANGMTRLVGGAVRDALLGQAVSDVDLATRFTPDQVAARLDAAGVRTVPTGIAHGTVTAVTSEMTLEITTLRHDVSTDGRRATVAFTDDWKEDAARRDFTINALYANPLTGEVFDYFDGLADLRDHHVRFIGDPFARIAEDHLRILRFFRFHARFGREQVDAAALEACAARANDLMALSRERIRDELLKLLVVRDPLPTLGLMGARAILRPILPEIDMARLGDLENLMHAEAEASVPACPLRRLAALLPADAALLSDIAARLRLSNKQRKAFEAMALRLEIVPSALQAAAYRAGRDVLIDRLLLLSGGDAVAGVRALLDWTPPKLPIAGRDLIAGGLIAGPDVSRALKLFETAWVDAGFPMTPPHVAQLKQAAIAQVRRVSP